jgi:hypothetical protein
LIWTEGYIHVAARRVLRDLEWELVAGEFPGGSDSELYPLCVVDRRVARDNSPDPRRHSVDELIPDIVALRDRELLIGEAKVNYSEADRLKLQRLLGERRLDLLAALEKFALERGFPSLLPISSLVFRPTLVFASDRPTPPVPVGFSYLRLQDMTAGYFEGDLGR